jgi:hypothetical protein
LRCEIGDIVLVNNFSYPDGTRGSLHSFVVVGIRQDEFELINLDYICFLISSQVRKNNDVNPNFPYNEPLHPDEITGLREEGHVKCDLLYDAIKEDDIIMRVGTITPAQYQRFMELYRLSLKS